MKLIKNRRLMIFEKRKNSKNFKIDHLISGKKGEKKKPAFAM